MSAEETTSKMKRKGAIASTLADVLADLEDLEFSGTPTVGGIAEGLSAVPGLSVKGIGMISLPLQDEDIAKKLVNVASQSPFGKGPDTLMDTSVRKSWQIEPDKVSFANPSFEESIQTLAKKAAQGLGVPEEVSIEAFSYKMLLYETGGFIKKHRDTEKKDGMFATLVVQLPSIYLGGNLKVSVDNDKEKVYHMGTNDATTPFCCHYVAHYADCEHEVEPVLSGYRLSLVYSLCRKKTIKELRIPTM